MRPARQARLEDVLQELKLSRAQQAQSQASIASAEVDARSVIAAAAAVAATEVRKCG